MTKKSNRKMTFTTIVISMLLVSIAYAVLMPSVHGAEKTTQEKALTVLNDVVGLDVGAYRTSLINTVQDSYWGVLPKETLQYTLESSESRLDVSCEFVNNALHMIYVGDWESLPRKTKPATNVLETAKGFMSNYQTYSGSPNISALKSMLDTVETGKNVTVTSGNSKLEVTIHGSSTSFKWTYVFKGAVALSKTLAFGLKDGVLKYFIDDWSFYRIGSYDIKLSEEEAVSTAIESAKDYSWIAWMGNYSTEVKEFSISKVCGAELVFVNEIAKNEARGGDPLTLYPCWRLRLALDKIYPGNVYGLIVDVWADTKKVSSVSPASFMGTLPTMEAASDNAGNAGSTVQLSNREVTVNEVQKSQTSITWIALPISIVIAAGVTAVCLGKKKASSRLDKVLRRNFLKLGGALLCLLILLAMVSIRIPAAKAESVPEPRGSAVAYGITWNITDPEKEAAEDVCQYLEDHFGQQGYDVTNAYGTDTRKSFVFGNASIMAQDYHRVAVFHYGHGGYNTSIVPIRYDYFDNYGWAFNNQIYDYEIYPQTGLGKHFFVFLWTCRQGDLVGYMTEGKAKGMPFAWTHKDNLSPHGFNDSDNSPYCFIGFKDASAPLDQIINGTNHRFKEWLTAFYDGALNYGYSIHTSLDHASLVTSSCLFNGTELWEGSITGFKTTWGGPITSRGWLKVYGNSKIFLNQHSLTVLAKDQANNNYADKDVYIDLMSNIADTNSTIKATRGTHTIFVNDFWEPDYTWNRYTFQNYTYYSATNTSNPLTRTFYSDYTITAHFIKTHCPGDVDGDSDADSDDWDLFNSFYPSQRGDYKWDSRGDFNADGIVNDGDRDQLLECLPAVTVLGYDESSSGNVNGIIVYVNGTQAGVTGDPFHLPPGTYSIGVDGYGSFHNFSVGGNTYPNNPANIPVASDMTITASYYSLPSYDVTVLGLDYPDEQYFQTNVYIDSQYVGQTDDVFSVKLGAHSIEVDGWGGEGATFYYFDFDGVPQSQYVNPTDLPVFGDMTVTAYYIYGK